MRAPPRRTLADQVADHLRRRILSGDFAPGDKLVPELTLASELRVNRFTVREAMNRLEQLHLIARRPGAGTVVLDYNHHAGVDIIEDLVTSSDGRLNPFVVSNLLECARILSSEIATLAAERRTESDLSLLARIAGEMRSEAQLSRLLWLDFDFNWALAGAAANFVPRLVLNSVRGLIERYAQLLETLFVPKGSITEGYEHVVEAIRTQDPIRARALVQWIWHFRQARFVDLMSQTDDTTVAAS